MKGKMMRRILAMLSCLALFACGGCDKGSGENSTGSQPSSSVSDSVNEGGNGGENTPELSVPVAENFSFSSAFTDADGWLGIKKQNPVLDSTNSFLTFREKSNDALVYQTKGMSQGSIQLKVRVRINADTTAYVSFSDQSATLGGFCYAKGSKMYTLEFSNDSKMYVKKWVNGEEFVLSGNKASTSTPLSLATKLTDIKIDVKEESGSALIKVYSGDTKLLDVKDSDSPILGGGAVGVSYTGLGGMLVAGENSDISNYQAPDELGINIYDQPNVSLAETDVNLLADFASKWTGRERIFNAKEADGKVVMESKDNPEEPQAGVTEYQAVYTDKIFKDVQLEYSFNVISHGEWIMFWLRCVPETSTDVSIWGNKKTGENTNGYSMLITVDGYVQIHKWTDGTQIWLNGQGTKLPGNVTSLFSDSNAVINLKTSIKQIEMAGEDAIEFRISVNDSTTIVVQDTDTPYLNAGYVGMQGYAINNGVSSIRLISANARKDVTM